MRKQYELLCWAWGMCCRHLVEQLKWKRKHCERQESKSLTLTTFKVSIKYSKIQKQAQEHSCKGSCNGSALVRGRGLLLQGRAWLQTFVLKIKIISLIHFIIFSFWEFWALADTVQTSKNYITIQCSLVLSRAPNNIEGLPTPTQPWTTQVWKEEYHDTEIKSLLPQNF